jgi:hypothetical protein
MTDLQELAEIEALKNVMAKFARFGDTQNWAEFHYDNDRRESALHSENAYDRWPGGCVQQF